jgi:hypothetical protein
MIAIIITDGIMNWIGKSSDFTNPSVCDITWAISGKTAVLHYRYPCVLGVLPIKQGGGRDCASGCGAGGGGGCLQLLRSARQTQTAAACCNAR